MLKVCVGFGSVLDAVERHPGHFVDVYCIYLDVAEPRKRPKLLRCYVICVELREILSEG